MVVEGVASTGEFSKSSSNQAPALVPGVLPADEHKLLPLLRVLEE